ncbi:hypothetical protein ACPVPU_03970 [Sphingomonas sp. CJ99]
MPQAHDAGGAGSGAEGVARVIGRIDAIAITLGAARADELARAVEAVRAEAQALGLCGAVPVIHAIEAALARGERAAGLAGWLALLRDAVDCGRMDPDAERVFAAACSVRAIRAAH